MEFVKFFHFFALFMGGAAGFGHLALDRAEKKIGGPPPEHYKIIRPMLGMFGLIAIVLLWITGVIMYRMEYADAELGAAFLIKLAAAGIMLVVTIYISWLAMKAGKAGTPPPPIVAQLGKVNGPLAWLALALAVYVFR